VFKYQNFYLLLHKQTTGYTMRKIRFAIILLLLATGFARPLMAQDMSSDIEKANQYRAIGNYSEALMIFEKWLPKLGDMKDYSDFLNSIGELYFYIGEYSKAEANHLESLKIRKLLLGETHPDYVTSLNELGVLYANMGNYPKAEPFYLKALDINKQTFGENHPDYSLSLNNLGVLYVNMGYLQKAEPCYLRSIEIRKQVLGENHSLVKTMHLDLNIEIIKNTLI
jgi:tetratricopeptide (TPR) repeat protein